MIRNIMITADSNKSQNKIFILIMDTGAHQCTCGKSAWITVYDTGEKLQCNGYYQGVGAKDGPVVPIISVVTCVEIPGKSHF